jgi:hypothetical protein|tara:strand:+ start:519 stop:680 length:162 start_codon:yes stop_codon:yes gene_type:complete
MRKFRVILLVFSAVFLIASCGPSTVAAIEGIPLAKEVAAAIEGIPLAKEVKVL